MTADTLNTLLTKLGTTIDKIIPATVDYCKHASLIRMIIFLSVFVICVAGLIVGKNIYNGDNEYAEELGSVLFFTAFIAGGIFFVLLVSEVLELYKWNAYPVVKAYETILHWIGGN